MKINKALISLGVELGVSSLAGVIVGLAARPAIKDVLSSKRSEEKISSEDISTDEIKKAI